MNMGDPYFAIPTIKFQHHNAAKYNPAMKKRKKNIPQKAEESTLKPH